MARRRPPDRTPPPPDVRPRTRTRPAGPTAPAEASPGDRPPWPPIRPATKSGPRRDRRRPLRPRQIILAVLVALGVGALLGSSALVGLAERQPLGTQRDIALGAAKVADRLAHGLSLNRPAERLAAALDGEEEVYDVEALIARARAAAPAATEPPPPPAVAGESEDEPAVPRADGDGTAATEPTGGTEADPADGPPAGGIITPLTGIDCVPEDAATPTTATDDPEDATTPTTATDDAGPAEADPPEAPDRPEDPEATGGATEPATTADPGEDRGSDEGSDTGESAETSQRLAEGEAPPDDADDAPTEDTAGAIEGDDSTGSDQVADPDDPNGAGGSDGGAAAGAPVHERPDPGAPAGEDDAEPADPTNCPPGFVPATEATDAPADGTAAPDESAPTADPEEASETISFEAPRVPDEDRPLAMYVGGDSISRDLGEGLARVTPADLVGIDLDPRPATGLSRPDFFDWAQHLAGVLTESVPDVIVVLFGANDFQDVAYEGEILDRFGDEWLELYRRRVDRIMTLLSQPDTQTVWVGQPPVRESRLSGGLARMNAVYEEVAAEHPQVTYVDTWALFSNSEGDYADEIDGVRVRREDGVHLTIAGGNRLAEAVWGVVGAAWGLQ